MASSDRGNRVDEELVAIDALAHHLRERCGCRRIHVKREDDDPPDFWIDVDGQSYAVEVTSIVTGQAYRAACRTLKEMVRNTVMSQGILSGTYVLRIRRHPDLPRRNSPEWRALVDRAVSFVGATAPVESARESSLLADGQGRLDICRVSAAGNTVGLVGPTEVKWEGEVREELQHLMQEAVATKRGKFEKKGVPAQCPRVLLVFYDAYGFGDQDDARHALLLTTGYDWFHSIFWAASFTDRANEMYPDSPGRGGSFLYSRAVGWVESQPKDPRDQLHPPASGSSSVST